VARVEVVLERADGDARGPGDIPQPDGGRPLVGHEPQGGLEDRPVAPGDLMTGPVPVVFPHLFRPLALGGVTLANRIVSSGHDTVMAEHGQIGDRLIAYHEARARGGAGLIVVQVAGVHETARYTSHVMMATDDSCIPAYPALAAAGKPHGTGRFGPP